MNNVALVTGGAKGIGLDIAKQLSKEGFNVVATYNTTPPPELADKVIFKKLDITNQDSCKKFVTDLVKDGLNPSILINNAGVTRDGMFHKISSADWCEVLNVNLLSLFCITQEVFKIMRDQNFGRIINISSVNANKGQVGQVNYCASKAGVQGFTKALALEGARYGVTVNTVSPGYINTDMVSNINPNIVEKIKSSIPVGRLGETSEISRVVCFLASEKSSFITGSNIEINGGMYFS